MRSLTLAGAPSSAVRVELLARHIVPAPERVYLAAMAYETNRFCWHGLITAEPDKAAAFYTNVLGWKVLTMEMAGEPASMFMANDGPIGHFRKPEAEGIPTHWMNYLRVDNVDESTKAAVTNGGKVLSAPMEIPPGRFSVVATPSGAALTFFHEADEAASTHHPGGIGGVEWTELHSTDLDKDLAWLTSTLGFELGEMPMPSGTYYLLKTGDKMRGGAMTAMAPGAPSMWLTWFAVASADDAVERVKTQGGNVLSEPMDMPGVGRMAVVTDPSGGVFGVMQSESKD